MNIQNLVSLEIGGLRDKAIDLVKEFDSKNKLGRTSYNKRLDKFLKKRIGKQTDKILVAQISLSASSLQFLNQKV